MPAYVYDKAQGCLVEKATGKPSPLPTEYVQPRIHLALDYKPYSCPITGKPIEGRRAHQENLKRNGCRVLERGEKEANMRERADQDRQLERKISDAVEQTAAQIL